MYMYCGFLLYFVGCVTDIKVAFMLKQKKNIFDFEKCFNSSNLVVVQLELNYVFVKKVVLFYTTRHMRHATV